jgi:light-harvesting complex 1 alpha chain
MQQQVWQLWQYFNPRLIIMGTVGSLFALAFFIHIILFSSPAFNWLQGSATMPAAAAQMTPLPKLR